MNSLVRIIKLLILIATYCIMENNRIKSKRTLEVWPPQCSLPVIIAPVRSRYSICILILYPQLITFASGIMKNEYRNFCKLLSGQ